jgi:hypothetical protein
MEICLMCYKFFDESVKGLVRCAEWCQRTRFGIVKDALEQDKLVPIYDPRDCFRFKGYYNDHYEVVDGELVKKSDSDSDSEPDPPPHRPPMVLIAIGAAVVAHVVRRATK